MGGGQYDNTVVSDTDQNIQGPTVHLCAKFGCSAPKGLGVGGQRNKHADRLMYFFYLFVFSLEFYLLRSFPLFYFVISI